MITHSLIGAIAGSRRRSSSAGPTLIANVAKSGSATTATTTGIDTTNANFLVLIVASYSASAVTITDSKSNTWTALTIRGSATTRGRFYYCYSPTVGTGHTFTASGASVYVSLAVQAWSGMAASPFDLEAGAAGTASSLASGSITPTQANTLVVTGCTFDNNVGGAVSISSPSGFTITDTNAYVAASAEGSSFAYKILTSSSAQNVTWNITSSTTMTSLVASFKY